MSNKKPQGFFIYADRFATIAGMLSHADVGRLVIALCAYFETGEMPAPRSRAFDACFQLMRSDVDRSIEQYQTTCERNRERAAKRWNAAGGPAAAQQHAPPVPAHAAACHGIPAHPAGCQSNQTEPNQTESNQTEPNQTEPKQSKPDSSKPRAAQDAAAQGAAMAQALPRGALRAAGTISPMMGKGGDTDERTNGTDPRFTRCTAI